MVPRFRRPVVGVVGHGYVVPRTYGDLPVTGTPALYVEAIAAAGARPVLLPGARAVDLLDLVDALVLTGGGDVDPTLYGGDPGAATEVDRGRDDSELAVVHAAARSGIPLLGVCRGAQLLAVAFGGRLADGVEHVRPGDGHPVTTAAGSQVRRVVGDRTVTSALHRQAIVRPGAHWRPTAWADDGTIEAIEWAAGDWAVLGVQWHPELAWHDRLVDGTGPVLFDWLVTAAASARPRNLVRS